jgi:hypothetical protein
MSLAFRHRTGIARWSRYPGNLLKEAAFGKRPINKSNLAESFPLFDATSLVGGDVENRYLLATPSCAQAVLLRYKLLHSLYFAKRPVAKNLVSAVLFHLVSLDFLLVKTIARLEE